MAYNPSKIEPKWQNYWEKNQTFKTSDEKSKPKYYVLDMFPYPSSTGLHVGHPEGYTATDIIARYKRAKGFNVLHPMGWDAFGLPAEQYAIKTGVHPAKTTNEAITNFRRQLSMLGFSFDWSREISTADPKYYKWTQWVFLRLYERGLVYQTEAPVNWCPELKTVLANDEVVDGKSERGGHPVFRVPMKQWMFKITDYAEKLLQGLDKLDWPEGTKELQRNWIGKSAGLEMNFKIENAPNGADTLEIFTTRPDTLWGVSYMALAPEHPFVDKITTADQKAAVQAYKAETAIKSEIARQDASKEKTGCFTGAYAINPVNNEKVPIWISDYVMMSYGTGAVMAVPAHDDRDFEFAKKFLLPIKKVVEGGQADDVCFAGDGVAVNSGFINGLKTNEALAKTISWAEENKVGKKTIKYKLRDWLFSRQRYWGEPFPLIKDKNGKIIPLKDNELPVALPDVQSYEPTGTGESPLAGITSWRDITIGGEKFQRETDTMPGSAGSSWYFLRYIDPHNDEEPWSKEAEKYWMPVDLYLGGDEHAVGHLLYSRFWTKVLFDCGLVSHDEPFKKLVHQGMILGEDGEKMSKSRGNVINPDDVVKEYGSDTLRLYEMFMGPLDKDKPWSTAAIEGTYRFLNRAYRIIYNERRDGEGTDVLKVDDVPMSFDDEKILHVTIKKVTEDIEGMRFNTAISSMMVFVNHFTAHAKTPKAAMKIFTQLLAPFAPHLAEEFWEAMGFKESLSYTAWPTYNPELVKADSVTIAVQVLGKLRGTLDVEPGASQAALEDLAKKDESIAKFLEGKQIVKVIYVQNKILNFVVK
ncbi:MAG: leucine--tRNA ligase [Bdellovibrionales bacterium]|nr:leucine--tRNA ligase [Bdellovibrionales bacterium]